MPQLDVSSFTTQIFWLLLIFFGFYFLILKFVLPNIARILKLRLTYKFSNSNDKININARTSKKNISKQIKSIIQSRSDKLVNLNKNLSNSKSSELAFYSENFKDLNTEILSKIESSYIKRSLLENIKR